MKIACRLRSARCRGASPRLFEAAQHRRGRLTVAGKRHVLQVTDGLFFAEVKNESVLHPNVTWREMDVDAMAADLCTRPEDHDVILAINMFGVSRYGSSEAT